MRFRHLSKISVMISFKRIFSTGQADGNAAVSAQYFGKQGIADTPGGSGDETKLIDWRCGHHAFTKPSMGTRTPMTLASAHSLPSTESEQSTTDFFSLASATIALNKSSRSMGVGRR